MMVDRVDIEVDNLMTNQVDGKSLLMLRGITGFNTMRGSRKFFQRGSNFDNVFFWLMSGSKYHLFQAIICTLAER